MNDDNLRIVIEGEPVDTGRGGAHAGGGDLEEIERRAATAHRETARARAEIVRTRRGQAAAQIEANAARHTSLKHEIRDAMEMGDYARATDLQANLAETVADRRALQQWKAQLDAVPETTGDPAEDFARTATAPTAAWVRAHPEFFADERKRLKLTAAHNDALAEGHAPDTDAYFEHVERHIGVRAGGGVSRAIRNGDGAAPAPSRRATPSGGTQVHFKSQDDLNRAKETAESLGIEWPEYLRRLQKVRTDPQYRQLD